MIDLIKKEFVRCKVVSKEEKIPFISLAIDCFFSYLIYGCVPSHYFYGKFYRFSHFERSKILTYKRALRSQKHFNDSSAIKYLLDKSLFNEYFREFIKRDWLDISKSTFDEFDAFLVKHKEFIVKPKNLMQGKGVRIETCSKEMDLPSLYSRYRNEDVIIEEIIQQHPSMVFNNNSVNTIRVMSVLDKSGKCHILKTILRVGIGNSVVDNYCAGGCIYSVNESCGVIDSYGATMQLSRLLVHPGSDILMLGLKLPNWDKVVDLIERAHPKLPKCRYVGWDVAITKDGVELIEGNHDPDYELYEFIGKSALWSEIKKVW